MELRFLGTIDIRREGGRVVIPGVKARVLLAVLASQPGVVIPSTRLRHELWGAEPPLALSALPRHVWELRKRLGADTVVTRSNGYLLDEAPEHIDVCRFDELLRNGHEAMTAGQWQEAEHLLGRALRLWRGPALADVPHSAHPRFVHKWEETRMTTLDQYAEVALRLGHNELVVDQLDLIVDDHPTRERLVAHYLLGLYRSGRRAEALRHYLSVRERLIDVDGVEPGEALRSLQQRMLRDDPALQFRAAAGGATGERSPRQRPDPDRPRGSDDPARRRVLAPLPRPAPARADDDVIAAELAEPTTARSTVPVVAMLGDRSAVPRQLPAAIASFTGRTGYLQDLDAALCGPRPDCTPLVIGISGSPGVGKTSLALHWAHAVRDRFPDGQLWIDLRGHASDAPRQPDEALAMFLDSLGVDADRMPPDELGRSGLFRSLVADRQVLIVLDNAADADHVRPLLPGAAGCLVVVTSRASLTGLTVSDDACLVRLDALDRGEAMSLLRRLAGGRVEAEPEAAAELIALTGGLPLAIRIATAQLLARPGLSMRRLVDELRTGDRLGALSVNGDPRLAVRVAFDHSYERLSGPAQDLFRLLSVVPGSDITPRVAAVLADRAQPEVDGLIGELESAHLIERRGTRGYQMHDLLRLYAGQRAEAELPPERITRARDRLVEFSLRTVRAAVRMIRPVRDGVAAEEPSLFPDQETAARWLHDQRGNLGDLVRNLVSRGSVAAASALVEELSGYFRAYRRYEEWATLARLTLAAQHPDDAPARAALHHGLGTALQLVGHYREAVANYVQARDLYQRCGDAAGRAAALTSLAGTYSVTGRLAQAEELLDGVLAGQRARRPDAALVDTLLAFSTVCFRQGRLTRAAELCAEALELALALGYRSAEANCLNNLGAITLELGDYDRARTVLRRGLGRGRAVGGGFFAPHMLANLACVERDTGRHEQALRYAEEALCRAQEAGVGAPVQDCTHALATIRHSLGDLKPAIEYYRIGLRQAHQDRDQYLETDLLARLAAARHELGETAGVVGQARTALSLARHCGYQVLEARSLVVLAQLHLNAGDPGRARLVASAAHRLCEQTGHRLGAESAARLVRAAQDGLAEMSPDTAR